MYVPKKEGCAQAEGTGRKSEAARRSEVRREGKEARVAGEVVVGENSATPRKYSSYGR